jgi:hypothetical protein
MHHYIACQYVHIPERPLHMSDYPNARAAGAADAAAARIQELTTSIGKNLEAALHRRVGTQIATNPYETSFEFRCTDGWALKAHSSSELDYITRQLQEWGWAIIVAPTNTEGGGLTFTIHYGTSQL